MSKLRNVLAKPALMMIGIPLLAAVLALSGCNGAADGTSLNDVVGTVTPTPTPTPTPVASATASSLVISSDKTTLKSGSTDQATLTLTALDANNGAMAGIPISVSTKSGVLSSSTVTTGSNGTATISFSPGQDRTNRTQVISFTSGTVSSSSAVQVVGTKLTATTSNTSISATPQEVDVLVTDGTGAVVPNTVVTFSSSGSGSLAFSAPSATTNTNGIASVNVSSKSAGGVTFNAVALGSTASLTLNSGSGFQFTSPSTNPSATQTNASVTLTVSAPSASQVQFVSSNGTLGSSGQNHLLVAVSGGVATTTFQSSTAGIASISAYDTANPTTSSNITIAVSSAANSATAISIQALPAVLAPSTVGGTVNTSTLTVKVTDSGGNGVAGVPVSFSMTGMPGGGEAVSPQVVVTGSSPMGVATATFTSGTLPTTQGSPIHVTATALLPNGSTIASITPANIVIGGTSASVAIGQSSVIASTTDNTAYQLPMSVIVADSNGNPMANTVVSLSVWPVAYSIGEPCTLEATFANEDANENLVADAGEIGNLLRLNDTTFSQEGLLTKFASGSTPTSVTSTVFTPARSTLIPPNSAAGTIPATVTTDANGRASFTYTYLKSNAIWIVSRLRASTTVQGSQTTAQSTFRLPVLNTDVTTCVLPASPYNSYITFQ
ncbi:beta strand repeat-containing protein [Silvimonas soli]|uniref:beta strand repeat-containing protein n=1 Tax=Silvimonas soli TaxID=2980100 RepID=UPI0024B3C862|nr:Ig-like domain-containing protein [Silvimonas soli]